MSETVVFQTDRFPDRLLREASEAATNTVALVVRGGGRRAPDPEWADALTGNERTYFVGKRHAEVRSYVGGEKRDNPRSEDMTTVYLIDWSKVRDHLRQ